MWPGYWSRRGPLALLLWPLSLLYRIALSLRKAGYRSGLLAVVRPRVPVIVVGNVVVGGSGKTPVLLELARHLTAQGQIVGVVSRGYGRPGRHCQEVLSGSLARDCGDEPLLIKKKLDLPVFVAADRGQAALALLERYPATTIILSDDGLQHLGLARDIEICLFGKQGRGNGLLLPAGPLREPWPRQTDLILNTSADPQSGQFLVVRKLSSSAQRADGSSLPLSALHGRRLVALAAIAHPDEFFDMLRAEGLELEQTIARPDHDDWSDFQWPDTDPLELIFTEKDAAKLWARNITGWAVPLRVSLDPDFLPRLDELLQARLSLKSRTVSDAMNG